MLKDNALILNMLSKHFFNGVDSDFAKFLGISPQTLSNWKARNTIDYDLVYTKCLNISGDWLLTGEGDMLRKQDDVFVKSFEVAEPSPGYGNNWKDRCIELQEEVMSLQKKIIQMQEENNEAKSKLHKRYAGDTLKLTFAEREELGEILRQELAAIAAVQESK